MKYLFINSVIGYGSTGRLVADKCHELMREGHECRVAWGRINTNAVENADIDSIRIGSRLDIYLHALLCRFFDGEGLGSKRATKKLIRQIKEYGPNVIWLHNIHGYYINYELLFEYIKSVPGLKVVWTLHDCWTMTGHCSHFMMSGCDKYKEGCKGNCPEKKNYPSCIGFSNVKRNWQRKQKAFTGVKNLSIITPCQWMADVVKESYLKDYPVQVIYNTVDENIFKPTKSDFREKNGLIEKKILLGVASVWSDKKGLLDFIRLSERLKDTEETVVLVGIDDRTKEKLLKYENLLCLPRTNSAKELAEIYTAADIYLNLTYEDNYPTTNLEAKACGTPVITYRTGGSPESVPEEMVVEPGDLDSIIALLYNHVVQTNE